MNLTATDSPLANTAWPALWLVMLLGAATFAWPATGQDAFQSGWTAYEHGDYREALDAWSPLAKQGHVGAQINLAVMYDHGIGVSQDIERALRWYQAAAGQDSAVAQYNLGLFLLDRQMLTAQDEGGLDWLRKAAGQNYADAQYQLGVMCAEGAAGETEIAQAPTWLYEAGINYISNGDIDGAHAAATALRQISPQHLLYRRLQSKLADHWRPPQQDVDDTLTPDVQTGTAWPTSSGYAITNYHVVSGKPTITLVNTRGEEMPATLVASDELNDVAVLSVVDPSRLPAALPLACTSAALGATVFTIGFPRVDIMGKTPKLSLGIISGMNGLYDDPASYQISVPLQPGNSGGPLLNMQGEVVGLITSMLATTESNGGNTQLIPNINYALKAERIEELLLDLPPPPQSGEPPMLTRGQDSLEALAHRIQDSVMIVRAGTSLSP